ncbi:CAT RNA binding domain-containing protein [Ligilactobacillus pobuzihii]|uniref:CAT RNA binding domain-containing protein n=1 Tax=Ligilactobacillus pobuzihii TaxID=449659 RepID=UPI000375AD67|nr:CAT RNA binding domain-containing protein [Ligilactobacillus pobuzihii]GEN48431.1 hypothetical protein LPO01_12230 [Ligilactobacillus pobuzihii]
MKVIHVYGRNLVRVRDSTDENIMLVDKGIGYKKHRGDEVHPGPNIRNFVKKIA